MQVSVRERHTAAWLKFNELGGGANVRVLVDGVPAKDCFFADDEAGFMDAYARNEKGEFYPDQSGEEAATVRAYGRVTIQRKTEDGWVDA